MRIAAWAACLVLAACGSAVPDSAAPLTTAGSIAIANLDHQIEQSGDRPGVEALLLARSRFLGDYEALGRATALAESRSATAGELLARSRARSAGHRFADALADLDGASRAGADREEVAALRASIAVATGRAADVVPELEAAVARHPGFESRAALAGAYGAVGRLDEADRLYAAALEDLATTSPFPYAWIYFARGVLWAEEGNQPTRGQAMYARALAHLPEFAAANIHLAELEVAAGDLVSSAARLERVVAASGEPEALALLGEIHARRGQVAAGRAEIARARERYEWLLARHPAAFADHAAEFYLGPGGDPDRAWRLARQNVEVRPTARARALLARAARATGRDTGIAR